MLVRLKALGKLRLQCIGRVGALILVAAVGGPARRRPLTQVGCHWHQQAGSAAQAGRNSFSYPEGTCTEPRLPVGARRGQLHRPRSLLVTTLCLFQSACPRELPLNLAGRRLV